MTGCSPAATGARAAATSSSCTARPAPIAVPAGAHAVSADTPAGPGEPLVKRVTALAGDPQPDGAVVPPGHVFVLSDNDGLGSRLFGPVPLTAVTAVVRRRLR